MSIYACPHCGEQVDTAPDPGGGDELEYIEDCPVCCRPNVIVARYDPDSDDFTVSVTPE